MKVDIITYKEQIYRKKLSKRKKKKFLKKESAKMRKLLGGRFVKNTHTICESWDFVDD